VTSRARFPESPFWLDDDPARRLRERLSSAGLSGWATGAGIRDAALGIDPFAPPVVELLVPAAPEALGAALGSSPDPSGAFVLAGPAGRGRFVLRALGDGPEEETLAAGARDRDFTANAILCGLDGRVLDPLDGIGDIAARRVRLAHPASLRDDPVRVVRLARMRILLGEESPDPEAMDEAGIYGADVAACPGERVLAEMVRLMRCGSPARVGSALRWLDGIGALDGLALLPDPGRAESYLAACADAGIVPDPYLALGMLCALRIGRKGWIDGLRPRFGDARDARVEHAVACLSGSGDAVAEAVGTAAGTH
jgi:poly(A) polymerase